MGKDGEVAHRGWIELLKYPILVFSILLAVVIAHWALDLEFGAVAELGTEGIKFTQHSEATLQVLTALEAQVNEMAVRLEAVENRAERSGDAAEQVRNEGRVAQESSDAAQTVSDATAQIARIQRSLQPEKRLRGYVWVGDFDGSWTRTSIGLPDSRQAVEISPDRMQPGTQFVLLENMVVRNGLPTNDAVYFRGRQPAGVLPRGSLIRIIQAPVGIDREFAVQYWAEIEEVSP